MIQYDQNTIKSSTVWIKSYRHFYNTIFQVRKDNINLSNNIIKTPILSQLLSHFTCAEKIAHSSHGDLIYYLSFVKMILEDIRLNIFIIIPHAIKINVNEETITQLKNR